MWIAAVAAIGSSMIGAEQNSRARQKAEARLADIIGRYERIKVPTVEEQRLILEEFKSAGLLTPELQKVVLQGDSGLKEIQEDARLREAQLGALTKLQQVADEGGMTLQDRARMAQIQGEVDQSDRGNREAIMQGMQRRGAGGSGQELAALLSSSQASTNRHSNEALNVQAEAQKRALDALMQSGQLGGQIRNQDWQVNSDKARAQDAINQFNTSLQNNVNSSNTDRVNQSRASNLANKQSLMNQNTQLNNQQQQYNKELIQQRYKNELAKVDGISGVSRDLAGLDVQRGKDQAAMWGGIGQGVGQIYSSYQNGKIKRNEDEEDFY
jgi:hypothetical protein